MDPLYVPNDPIAHTGRLGCFAQVAPANSLQPAGEATPWGVGTLVQATGSTSDQQWGGTPTSSSGLGQTGRQSWSSSASAPTSVASSTPTIFNGTCGWNNLCPEAAPCCSEWGNCGTGRSCLAGCNPLASFGPGACAPVAAGVDANVSR